MSVHVIAKCRDCLWVLPEMKVFGHAHRTCWYYSHMRWLIYPPWLLGLSFLFFVMPMFQPLFARMMEREELPWTSRLFFNLAAFNAAHHYLPAVAIIVVFLCLNEVLFFILRRHKKGDSWLWGWTVFATLAGLLLNWFLFFEVHLHSTTMHK